MPIYGAAGAPGMPGLASIYNPFPNASYAATVIGIGTIQIVPVVVAPGGNFSSVDLYLSNSYSATNAGSSMAHTLTCSVGFYTRNASSLSLATSASATTAFTVTGSTSSVSYQGLKAFPVGVALNMPPGNYWFAVASSTASAGNAIAGVFSNVVGSYAGGESAYLGVFGSSTAVSEMAQLGLGSYSVTSAALPAAIGFSEIIGSALGNTAQPIFRLKAYTV